MNCLDPLVRSGICTDPLGCVWEVSRHPLLIALVAWFLASWYQRRSKRWEFRANTLRDAASIYFRTLELVARLKLEKSAAPASRSMVTTSGQNVNINLAMSGVGTSARLTEAPALDPFVDLLFSGRARRYWRGVTDGFMGAISEENPEEIDQWIEKATEAYRKFIAQAGKEVGARTLWRRATTLWWRLRARLRGQTGKA